MIEMAERIILAGNPNVGKSTVFNSLTGMRQHTGNWPGKTVESAYGKFKYGGEEYNIIDLPGTYSFSPDSPDEAVAGKYIKEHSDCAVIVVCDATALERSMILALQTADLCPKTVLCVNLLDEAKRKGICIDLELLSERTGLPVFGTDIKDKRKKQKAVSAVKKCSPAQVDGKLNSDRFYYVEKAEKICHGVITLRQNEPDSADRKIDKVLLGKYTAVPCMMIMLALLFYITLVFSSYPSDLMYSFFDKLISLLKTTAFIKALPPAVGGIITDGMMKVLCWVTAVMLPPMAIFFALFTLLEDFGYLPRVAFCLDEPFRKCGTCGKQALTMCMGLGCNCTGVTGCRIIGSQKEKLISVLTNSFIPCNGRFPILIAVITMFFAGVGSKGRIGAALIFSSIIIFSILITFLTSKLLSGVMKKSETKPFVMELPPYRKPDTLKVIFRSVFDRTLFVLARAMCVAAPAGVIIWLLTHINIYGLSIFAHITQLLDPVGRIMGLDGVVLTGFLLGLPANEIVIPIIMMGYLSGTTLENYTSLASLAELFRQNGWDVFTAVSMIVFTVFHWPCSTAIITIKKETASFGWTAVSVILPTLIGFLLCCVFNLFVRLIQV